MFKLVRVNVFAVSLITQTVKSRLCSGRIARIAYVLHVLPILREYIVIPYNIQQSQVKGRLLSVLKTCSYQGVS